MENMREETKASSTVGSRREYPRGVLAGRDDVMLVRPLFSCSQGHAIWDGELIIVWDLAGYRGEAFGTESSSNMLSISNHDFFEQPLLGNPGCTLSF